MANKERLQELRDAIVQAGGRVTTRKFLAGEEAAVARAAQKVNTLRKADNPFGYRMGRFINNALSLISVIFVLVVVLFGVLLVPGFVIVAEAVVVYEGVAVVSPENAGIYAPALMFLYFVLLFIEQIILNSRKREPEKRATLRNISDWWKYFRGRNQGWSGRHLDPMMRGIRSAVFWVGVTIVLFGLLGRMVDKMGLLEGNWLEGLREIATNSTLSDFMEYLSSVALAIAFLTGVHFIVFFVYGEYRKLTGGVSTTDFFGQYSQEELETEEVEKYYLEQLAMLKQQRSSGYLPLSQGNKQESRKLS